MDILNSRAFDLGPTKSYHAREAVWFGRDANGDAGVIIRLWDEKRRERGTNSGRHGFESDLYEVRELAPLPGVMARHFGLLNKQDDGQKFVYRVLIGANKSCTCKCGLCHQYECKHVAAVEAALDSGFWDGLDDDPAPDDGVGCPRCGGELTTGPGHVSGRGHGTLTVCEQCGELVRADPTVLATA